VLLTLDTVRADRVGWGGGHAGVTPNLDRLAADGVVFTDAWTPRGQTWPALASLLTGRQPIAHGVRENGFQLPPTVPALTDAFRRAGFRTGAFLSNACEAWGASRFDHLACTQGPGELDGDQSRLQELWDRRAVEIALAWIAQSDEPFVAWVHLYDAHKPFPTTDALRERWLASEYRGPWRAEANEAATGHAMPFHERVDDAALSGERPGEAELEALRAYYDAGLTSVDANAGRLIEGLRARDLLDDVLVVVAADHGEELFDHGNYPYHGASIHGSTLRVPLVLRWPGGLPSGASVGAPVDLTDVAPTVLQLFDIAPPGKLDGASLLGRIAGAPDARAFLSEVVALDMEASPPAVSAEYHAIRSGRWRLVWNPDGVVVRKPPHDRLADPTAGLGFATALYDLESDPGELTDVSAAEPERVRALVDELARRLAELRAEAPRAVPPSPELIETLRSLGYVGDPR
jgi:arylsulfatase A-like enzyme